MATRAQVDPRLFSRGEAYQNLDWGRSIGNGLMALSEGLRRRQLEKNRLAEEGFVDADEYADWTRQVMDGATQERARAEGGQQAAVDWVRPPQRTLDDFNQWADKFRTAPREPGYPEARFATPNAPAQADLSTDMGPTLQKTFREGVLRQATGRAQDASGYQQLLQGEVAPGPLPTAKAGPWGKKMVQAGPTMERVRQLQQLQQVGATPYEAGTATIPGLMSLEAMRSRERLLNTREAGLDARSDARVGATNARTDVMQNLGQQRIDVSKLSLQQRADYYAGLLKIRKAELELAATQAKSVDQARQITAQAQLLGVKLRGIEAGMTKLFGGSVPTEADRVELKGVLDSVDELLYGAPE